MRSTRNACLLHYQVFENVYKYVYIIFNNSPSIASLTLSGTSIFYGWLVGRGAQCLHCIPMQEINEKLCDIAPNINTHTH